MWRSIVASSFFISWLFACIVAASLPTAQIWLPFAAAIVWMVVKQVLLWMVWKRTSPQWQKLAESSFFQLWFLSCVIALAVPLSQAWLIFAGAAVLLVAGHTVDVLAKACGC
jgi:Trk-type K+ transport system membrane component